MYIQNWNKIFQINISNLMYFIQNNHPKPPEFENQVLVSISEQSTNNVYHQIPTLTNEINKLKETIECEALRISNLEITLDDQLTKHVNIIHFIYTGILIEFLILYS